MHDREVEPSIGTGQRLAELGVIEHGDRHTVERCVGLIQDFAPHHRRAFGRDSAGRDPGVNGVRAGVQELGGRTRELIISNGHTGYVALYRWFDATETALVLRVRHQRESGYSGV